MLHADKAYDNPRGRCYLRRRGITARIARIGVESKQRLGRRHWVVERTVSWVLRYDGTVLTMKHYAHLACAHTCFKILTAEAGYEIRSKSHMR